MTIAVATCIGTAAATIVSGVPEHSAFIGTLRILCFVVDVAYIAC
jgi:hypothetical protein